MNKIFFQTHGCSNNFHESEVMMGLLSKAKFEIVNDIERADIIVINICTVKGENKALKEIKNIKEKYTDKKMLVAGCITKSIILNIREIDEQASLINTHNIDRIVEIVEETLHGNTIEALGREDKVKICMTKIRKNNVIGIVPILSGCNLACSYCSVRLIKGNLLSYPMQDVIAEASRAIGEGCKEIWITSQDNAAYNLDKNSAKLPELLNSIANIEGKFFIRLGMMNPSNVLLFLDDLIESYKSEKMFKFLHIPVQSGNDEILKLMDRKYFVSDFKAIVRSFRNEIKDITISTDVILGFPTETDEQFNDTLSLIREIKPDILNISRFQSRPGTKSAKLKQLPGDVRKNRSRIMTDIFANISRINNEKWLNWQGSILIDEKGKNESFIGRNFAYKPVVVKGNLKIGQKVFVEIDNVTSYDLRGKVVG